MMGSAEWTNEDPPRLPSVSLYPPVRDRDWESLPHIHRGIANFGNTCFLNATIQILFHTPNFVRWLQSSEHLGKCHGTMSCLMCHLLKTFRQFKSCKDPYIRPAVFAALTRNLFSKEDKDQGEDKQEDAHECLVFILNKLEEIFLNEQPRYPDFFTAFTNPIFRIFGGWLTTECVCSKCMSVSRTFSPFTNLAIDIKYVKSVQEAIDSFFEGDKVEDYSCYKCTKQNKTVSKNTCQKCFSFHEAPSTLVLQLKRFQEDRSKLLTKIKVNQQVHALHSYQLAGAILHSGLSSQSGHYLTMVKCPDDQWILCDDRKVTPVQQSYVNCKLEECAYILFYDRTDVGSSLLDKNNSLEKICPQKSSPHPQIISPLKIVSPLHILKKKKMRPKENSTVSSNDYFILSSTFKACVNDQVDQDCSSNNGDIDDLGCKPLGESTSPEKFVSPLNIRKRKRMHPKENSTVSSNEYFILSQTNKDFASSSLKEDIEDILAEKASSQKVVCPITIKKIRKTQEKENSEQSSNDYFILTQTNNVCGNRKDLLSPTDEGFQDQPPEGSPKEKKITVSVDVLSFDDHFQSGGIGSPKDEGFHEQKEDQENEDMFFECSPIKAPFKPIILYEDEVEGAILSKTPLTANNKEALKRWLELRGITAQGTKDDLVERVAMVMATGKSHIIDPRADDGKWYNAKAAAVREAESHLTVMTQANLEIPDNQRWQPFPSVDLPAMFNFGHIYFYLVESCPNLPFEDDLSDSDSSDSDLLPDPFDDEHKTINEVKMLRKGLKFFKSKFVRGLKDCLGDRCYFIKGQVRASMALQAYEVTVTVSKRSGSICKCTCQCKQQALGRCVHVSTVLLYVWSHIRLNGYGGKHGHLYQLAGLIFYHIKEILSQL